MPYMLGSRKLRQGRPFTTANGAQYPGNWLQAATPEELTAIGVMWVPDPPTFDSRFYFSHSNPRDVDDLKTNFIKEQKTTAGNMLANTDWYVVRKSEVGTAIPESVATYRAAVRTVCNTRETEITAATSTEQLEFIIKNKLTPWPEL